MGKGECIEFKQLRAGAALLVCLMALAALPACSPREEGIHPSPAGVESSPDPAPPEEPTSSVCFDGTFHEDGERSWSDYFDVPLSEQNYRLWIGNTGDTDLTVRLTSGSYTGGLHIEFEVPAGEEVYQDFQLRSEDARRYLSISGRGGAPFSGRVYVHSATEPEGLCIPEDAEWAPAQSE